MSHLPAKPDLKRKEEKFDYSCPGYLKATNKWGMDAIMYYFRKQKHERSILFIGCSDIHFFASLGALT